MKHRLAVTVTSLTALLLLGACNEAEQAGSPAEQASMAASEVVETPAEQATAAASEVVESPTTDMPSEEASAEEPASPSEVPTPTEANLEEDSRKALETYVEAERSTIEQFLAASEGALKDATVEAEGSDTVVFTYTFAEQRDKDEVQTGLEREKADLEKNVNEQVFPLMARAGVHPNQKARYVYCNPDGTELASVSFSSN